MTFVSAQQVQEGPFLFPRTFEWDYYDIDFRMMAFVPDYSSDISTVPDLDFRFSNFYLASEDYHLWSGTYEELNNGPGWTDNSSMTWQMRDCQVRGGHIVVGDPWYKNRTYPPGSAHWDNNLFEQVDIVLNPNYYSAQGAPINTDFPFSLHNNLFRGGRLVPQSRETTAGNWQLANNLFDRVAFQYDSPATPPLDHDYNAYWPLLPTELNDGQTARLAVNDEDGGIDSVNDVVLPSAPPYQSGPLGNYYLPDTTLLHGAGSDSAANLGLFHYTTRLDQTKEGDDNSKISPNTMVNIGLHYVAVDGSGKPKDMDFDGIPDYVENWHGDGDTGSSRIHTADETDWKLPATDGYTPDASNPISLNIDLSGDGLDGYVKAALQISPLDSSNPLGLKQVSYNSDWGIATFELPIKYDLLTQIGCLNVNMDGFAVGMKDICKASDGNTLFNWNTTYNSPGQHLLQARLDVETPAGDGAILHGFGAVTPFRSANPLQFFEDDAVYSDSAAHLNAQLYAQDPNGPTWYTIQIYDPTTSPATFVKGITNSTTTGMIQEDWDLTFDDAVTHYAGNSFNAVFSVWPPGSAPGPGNPNPPTTSPQPQQATKSFAKLGGTTSGNGFDIAYLYTPTTGAMSQQFGSENGVVWSGMVSIVDSLLTPQMTDGGSPINFESSFNNYSFEGNNQHGNGLSLAWPGYLTSQSYVIGTGWLSKKALYDSMADGVTKCFYVYGHGDATKVNDFGDNVFISIKGVGDKLQNQFDETGIKSAGYPYRLVFLDACNTAVEPDWPKAFGIYAPSGQPKEIGNQAFVGWFDDPSGHTGFLSCDEDNEKNEDISHAYTQTTKLALELWKYNVPIADCIDQAATPQNNIAAFPVSQGGHNNIVQEIKGDGWSYGHGPYDWPKVFAKPGKIYITGHTGLKRDGNLDQDWENDNTYKNPLYK